VFIADNLAYTGLSQPEENLSIWSGGMRHYAIRPDTVSRAGFKLMEALEEYPIVFKKNSENSVALDLGAAPGGWTKVLLERGLKVVAVDPVQLAPVLQADKNVEYYSGRAHEYEHEYFYFYQFYAFAETPPA
jgi:23S rRNA (cytidine2498-2'-O)-methyltransferase